MPTNTFAPNTVIESAKLNANFLEVRPRTFRTQATAAATTTLVVTDAFYQFFTGTTTQTCVLPVATTMVAGYGFDIVNLSSGVVTLNTSGGTLVVALAAGSKIEIICKNASGGTGTASWEWVYIPNYATGAPPNGLLNQVLKSSGSNSQSWTYATMGDVQAKTTTYTALVSDGFINCSGSAFTVTLFAASGNAGKVLTITKTDSTLTNIITIDGNSTETINGALTTTLNTQYESVVLYCDGTNWQILSRAIPSVWTTYTLTIGAVTTPPGTGTGLTKTSFWRRVGDSIEILFNYSHTGAGTAGTGIYKFPLPSGITIDTAKGVTVSTGATGLGGTVVGNGSLANTAAATTVTAGGAVMIFAYDTSNLRLTYADAATTYNAMGSGGFSLNNTAMYFSFKATVPISGWNA